MSKKSRSKLDDTGGLGRKKSGIVTGSRCETKLTGFIIEDRGEWKSISSVVRERTKGKME